MDKSLDIFDFSDYREFLKKWIAQARAARSGNLSSLAKKIGVHTSYLAHILAGTKSLSLEQAAEIADVLELTVPERDFLLMLVQIDRAGSAKLRTHWETKKQNLLSERKKVRSRVGTHHELSPEDRAIYYSSWIYSACFVATSIGNGQALDQIAERLAVTRDKIDEVMSFLVRTGICDLRGGRYTIGPSVVFLTNDSPLIVKHHTNWRLQSLQTMDRRDADELFFTSPMSISKKDFHRIRELLAKALQASLEICKDSPGEELVCLNIDFFRKDGRR